MGLVGDSLLEPFWPEGTGIGRGFLGVLDTAWMVRRFCLEGEGDMVYEVIREREKLYSLLRYISEFSQLALWVLSLVFYQADNRLQVERTLLQMDN